MSNLQEGRQNVLIKSGDIFKLGEHKLMCADATDLNVVNKLINKSNIKLVVTDPPYGVGYIENKAEFSKLTKQKNIANDKEQTDLEYSNFTFDWISPILSHLASKNSFYIFNNCNYNYYVIINIKYKYLIYNNKNYNYGNNYEKSTYTINES